MAGFVAQSRDVTVISVAPNNQAPRRNLLPPNNLYRRSPLLLVSADLRLVAKSVHSINQDTRRDRYDGTSA
jgi:hypothetical protein